MSACNYTRIVTPNTCLGDSLATFNSNFSALDEGLCRQPDMIGGIGIRAQSQISEQAHNAVEISTKNSFVYSTKFDFVSSGTVGDIYVSDNTKISTTTLQWTSAANIPPSLATFSTVSPTQRPPVVSIFWTASGTDNSTIFYTNSVATSGMGNARLNGSVTAFLSSGNYIYVGGDFTSVGTSPCRKLVILDLNGGTPHPLDARLGNSGTWVDTQQLSADGGFGLVGTINAILEWRDSNGQDLIIFGGTYQSLNMGRGLTIYNKNTDTIYPFYVNGEVNCLAINGDDLIVGGTFDYIHYQAQSASVISGLRKYTNGLAKITLNNVVVYPNSSVSNNFGVNVSNTFGNLTTVNAIAVKTNVTYIGGQFAAYNGSSLIASNFAILNGDGTINTDWESVVEGEVHTLAVDGNYLYAGGNIKSFYTMSQFFGAPRKIDYSYNAICFDITNALSPSFQYNWKPKFNGPVSKFAFHNSDTSTYVYCYGAFTQVNGVNAGYIAAVDKSFNNIKSGQNYILWKNNAEKPPAKINNALLRVSNSVLVGGNFQKFNEVEDRPYLIRINGVYETLNIGVYLKTAVWDFGAQLCNPGTKLSLNLTNFVTVTSYPGTYGIVNQTTFSPEYTSEIFKNYTEGSLLRFFVRRPFSSSNSLNSSAHIIGWKVDFN